MPMSFVRFCFFLLLSCMALAPVAAEPVAAQPERFALVIGNANYANGMLRNPVNDARAMASKLEGLGFKVLLRENLNREQMYQAIEEFSKKLKAGGVGLFYYAGHGMQIRGKNFLIPVDADIQREDDIEFRGVDANLVLSRMDEARNRVNILVLDACRNNPFSRNNRSANYGLAHMEAPKGTLIAFSTAPGTLAKDGSGTNSIYTRNLVETLSKPGIPVEEVFKEVRIAVARETHDQQIPWESTSLMGDFYFVPPGHASPGLEPHQEPAQPRRAAVGKPARKRNTDQPQTMVAASPAPSTKPVPGKAARDYDREGYEIELKARNLTAEQLPDLIAKAEHGDEIAQTTLGWAYFLGKGQIDGRGIPRNNKKVLKWTLAAALQGYPVAQNNLGAMYMDGMAVKLDYQKAQHYFQLAADQGYLRAQLNLFQVNTLLSGKPDMAQMDTINQSVQRQMILPVQ
jgi:hypothetical protein